MARPMGNTSIRIGYIGPARPDSRTGHDLQTGRNSLVRRQFPFRSPSFSLRYA